MGARTVGILRARTDCSNDQTHAHPRECDSKNYRTRERERNRKKKSGLSNAVSSLSIIILHSLSVYQREHIFADDEEELLFSYVRELP